MKFWKRYSLFLALPCPRVPESLRKRVVVDLQLGDLQQKKNNLPKYIDFHFQRNINCYNCNKKNEGEQVPKRWPDYISPQFFLLLNPRIPKRSRLTRNRRSHETTSRTGFEKGGGARKDPQSRYISCFSNARYREAAEITVKREIAWRKIRTRAPFCASATSRIPGTADTSANTSPFVPETIPINRPKNRFSPFSLSPINSRSNSFFFSLLGDDSGSTRKIPFHFIYTRNGMQFAVSGIFFLITISLQLSVGCLRENNR